jgi:16S rRNA (cytosine1402-N4)-methyltransferase
MRMDSRTPRTAADWVALLPEPDLAAALRDFADEPDAGHIAAAVCRRRARAPFLRTLDLARTVLEAKGIAPRSGKGAAPAGRAGSHPAAPTFQALRILVNREFQALDRFLAAAPRVLKPGGRIGVISFHSGEDRRVKAAFRDGLRAGIYAEASPEAVRPGPEERRDNPRSSPAKLRWAVRAP